MEVHPGVRLITTTEVLSDFQWSQSVDTTRLGVDNPVDNQDSHLHKTSPDLRILLKHYYIYRSFRYGYSSVHGGVHGVSTGVMCPRKSPDSSESMTPVSEWAGSRVTA